MKMGSGPTARDICPFTQMAGESMWLFWTASLRLRRCSREAMDTATGSDLARASLKRRPSDIPWPAARYGGGDPARPEGGVATSPWLGESVVGLQCGVLSALLDAQAMDSSLMLSSQAAENMEGCGFSWRVHINSWDVGK